MADTDDKYSKFEREILDILNGMDGDDDKKKSSNIIDFRKAKNRPKVPKAKTSLNFGDRLKRLTPAKLLGATLIFALAAVLLRSISSPIATFLVVAAIASFLGMFFSRATPGSSISSKPPRTKRWRGRDIELEPRSRRNQSSGGWRRFLPGSRDK